MLSVIVHGGAGRFFPDRTLIKLPNIKVAVDAAWQVLIKGESGEKAVVAALHAMEDCEYFNAGYGGYPNEHGIVLLDVGLMRGDGKFASIINVRRVKYPSSLALDLLNERPNSITTIWTHELMCKLDAASEEEKRRCGWVATHEDLIAPFVKNLQEKNHLPEIHVETTHGTVGCVVRDAEGHLFAGTSTGGVNFKSNGRVGDTPIIGSGVYAYNEIGALSTTGNGEAILGSALSGFVLGDMRRDLSEDPLIYQKSDLLKKRLDAEIKRVPEKYPNTAAAIIVDPPKGLPRYALAGEAVTVASRSGSADNIVEDYARIEKGNGEIIENM